jgi:hypothetical protein
MKDQAKEIETLFEDAVEFGKTNLEIAKLKVVDKSSEMVASFVFQAILFVLVFSFIIFLNLGLAVLIGKLLGQMYLGFFVMGAFYLLSGLIFYAFFQKKIKKAVSEYIIKQVLN